MEPIQEIGLIDLIEPMKISPHQLVKTLHHSQRVTLVAFSIYEEVMEGHIDALVVLVPDPYN